jgi:hypothetical protein
MTRFPLEGTPGLEEIENKPRFFGWEAGIRTPIPWSRATCPTVGRPPSTSRACGDWQKRRL